MTDLGNRGEYIGGSDIAAILGLSPWTSRNALLREKITANHRDFSTAATRFGRDKEQALIEFDALECGYDLADDALALDDPQFGALTFNFPVKLHFDGIGALDGEKFLIECKTSVDAFDGELPEYYKPQVQIYLAALGLKRARIVFGLRKDDKIDKTDGFWVDADPEYFRDVIAPALGQFIVEIKAGRDRLSASEDIDDIVVDRVAAIKKERMSLELQIVNFNEKQSAIQIKNFEKLKAELTERAKYYDGLTFDDNKIKEAKAERSNLNNFKNSIETRRKEIKKAWAEPYLALETQVKELTAIIDGPIGKIDAQIKNFEERQEADRREYLGAYFDEIAKSAQLDTLIKIDQIFDPKWLNASTSLKSAKDDIRSRLDQIKNDLGAIDTLGGEYILNAKDFYLKNFNLSGAIAEHKRLTALKEALVQKKPDLAIVQPEPAPEPKTATPAAQVDKIYNITLRASGTKEVLEKLSAYAKSIGVTLQKIGG
jgi:predicted phage-related endonuclease